MFPHHTTLTKLCLYFVSSEERRAADRTALEVPAVVLDYSGLIHELVWEYRSGAGLHGRIIGGRLPVLGQGRWV